MGDREGWRGWGKTCLRFLNLVLVFLKLSSQLNAVVRFAVAVTVGGLKYLNCLSLNFLLFIVT